MLSGFTTVKKKKFFFENAHNAIRYKINKSEQRKIKIESEMGPKGKLVQQNI